MPLVLSLFGWCLVCWRWYVRMIAWCLTVHRRSTLSASSVGPSQCRAEGFVYPFVVTLSSPSVFCPDVFCFFL